MSEEEEDDSEGASSSTEEEGGPVRVLGNQLLAEVHIEQPTVQRSESPTFDRVGDRRRDTINVVDEETASRDMEDSNSHDEQEVNDDNNGNEDRRSNSNTV